MSTNLNHLISVIIPVFNIQSLIQKSIESVINQTYENIEIILINDGSSDNSGIICDNYLNRDSRIKVFHKTNEGPASARNLGIDHATGDLIFFLDADDYISLDALEILRDSYEKTSANNVVGNFEKIRSNYVEINYDNELRKNIILDRTDIVNYVNEYLNKPNKYSLFTHCWGRLFETEIIINNNIRFDENLHTFEDVKFNFKYLSYVENLFFLNKPIYHHLLHENFVSASHNMYENPEKLFGYQKALEEAGNFLKSHYENNDDLKGKLRHAHTVYSIIQLIRLCGQLTKYNYERIYSFIENFIDNSAVKTNLKFYQPAKGDSKIIPILIKLKLIKFLIYFCNYKATQRYNKK